MGEMAQKAIREAGTARQIEIATGAVEFGVKAGNEHGNAVHGHDLFPPPNEPDPKRIEMLMCSTCLFYGCGVHDAEALVSRLQFKRAVEELGDRLGVEAYTDE